MTDRKKSKKLGLEDYRQILAHIKDTKIWKQNVVFSYIIEKLEKKIQDLENPPVRIPKAKAQFKCKKCQKEFKRVPITCPECEERDPKIVKITEFLD